MIRILIRMGGHSAVARLVQTAPFNEGNLARGEALSCGKLPAIDRSLVAVAPSVPRVPASPLVKIAQNKRTIC